MHEFFAADGTRVWVRPLTSEDAPHLIDLFEHLSPQSRYQRFHEPLNDPDPVRVQSTAREIATEAPMKGRGWLAFANLPGQPCAPVGGVRWARVEADVAEVGITVRDDMQNIGIGRELLRLTVIDAHRSGVKKLIAVTLASNRAVAALARDSHVPLTRSIHAGELYLEADISDEASIARLASEQARSR
ncbi:MAG: GNAT family N-acetyltransferase [Caldilineales bacterium]|nr:GNAT family N-acetyltransferase [Caldilineales bacterium]